MSDRDVLICGACSSQYSDLKLFIEHKQTCGNGLSSQSNNAEISTLISQPQQTSHVNTQQQIPMVMPPPSHASIVSLPVGMPHVFLQTSSGLSQMYRIVLEPSLNATQITSSGQITQSNQMSLPTYTMIQQPNGTLDQNQYTVTGEGTKMELNEEEIGRGPSTIPLNEPSMTRLSTMAPVTTSWTQPRSGTPYFEPLNANVMDKNILDPLVVSSEASTLDTHEEDVATFLATQLVSQSAAPSQQTQPQMQQQSNCREGNGLQKYCEVADEQQPHVQENLSSFMTVGGDLKVEETSSQEKCAQNATLSGKDATKKSHEGTTQKNTMRVKVEEKGGKVMHCEFEGCPFFTHHKKDMIRHNRKHTGEKPYQCSECSSKFSRNDKLKIHMRTHSKERPYPCTELGCSYRAIEKAHLTKHVRMHTNERPYSCQFCPYSAKDGSHLTVHLRSHTGDTPFHCQMEGCSATFKTSSDLKRHLKLHSGIKPFKCSECTYASALKSNLKVHVRINHSKGERYRCPSCPFLGSSRKQFKEHEKAQHARPQGPGRSPRKILDDTPLVGSYPPLPLGQKQPTPAGKRGTSNHSSKPRRGTLKPACMKNFRCERCGCGFVREDSLRSHLRQHEGKKPPEISRGEIYPPGSSSLGLSLEEQRGKMKAMSPMNFVIQGPNASLFREILVNTPKEAKATSEEPMEVPPQTQSHVETALTDTFSYMIAIDGVSSVYSATCPPTISLKSPPYADPHLPSGELTQDDPVVHVMASSVNPQDQPQEPTPITSVAPSANVKVIPPPQRGDIT